MSPLCIGPDSDALQQIEWFGQCCEDARDPKPSLAYPCTEPVPAVGQKVGSFGFGGRAQADRTVTGQGSRHNAGALSDSVYVSLAVSNCHKSVNSVQGGQARDPVVQSA